MTDQERKDAIRFFEWVAEDEAMNYSRLAIEALKAQDDSKESSPTHKALDTISRRGAIDILDAYQVMVENGEEKPYEWARLRMSELPSVQPEIVRCGDCKHWICHDRRCGYWNHGVKPLEWCCHAERKENR